jgi:eukaryotic-like serine/threonine-protein kinase
MNPERWQRVDALFRTAIDHPADERDAYLTRVCDGDEDLRREVLSLLERDTAEDFIRDPIANAALAFTAKTKDDLTGERIGPYCVKRMIGRGGMGDVYEAERDDEHFRHQVAIKIIKRGMDTDFVRDRFLLERQILATLDHPHIARLFDGGAAPDGSPYFVMEFVAGEPITAYCHRHQLSVNEKLKLFRKVCSAVQHAHQRLVVHRDLKPSNILISEDGQPKLLDFGIAKLLSPEANHDSTRTETAMRMMTPEYASPEQARGEAVATTTDVYSLGVVLYELLTDRRPHEFRTFAPAEIERAICETAIEEPSKAVGGMTGAPTRLARQLAGDLDNITMMAMRKEPERRYQSVEQFSEDIRRHLEGMPVAARKDTFGYRAGKFVRRHKTGVAILSLLAILAVAMAVQSVRIARERDRANQEAATAQAVTKSLAAVFEFADPGWARSNTITAKELLDQGAEKVVCDLKDQPVVQAKLMDTIGGLYLSIGVYDRAQPLLEGSLKLRRQTLGSESIDVAESLHNLGALTYEKGDYARSETLYREALQLRRRLLGTESLNTADSIAGLGRVLIALGKFAEAEPLVRDALALRRRQLPPVHKDIASSLLHGLGRLMSEQGKFAEAAENYREALAIHLKLYGAEHPSTAASMNNLAVMLHELGDYQGAEALSREALELRRKLLGAEHPDVSGNMVNLASLLQDRGKYAEAEQLYRKALQLRRKLFGENSVRLAATMSNLATLLDAKGDYEAGEALQRQALAIQREQLGENHRQVGTSLHNLATMLYRRGRYSEAEKLQRQAIAIYQKSLKPEHWMIHRSRSHLGDCLIRLKRYREAEEQLLAAYAGLKIARGEQHCVTRKAVSRLIELYEAKGESDQASPYRALLWGKDTNSNPSKNLQTDKGSGKSRAVIIRDFPPNLRACNAGGEFISSLTERKSGQGSKRCRIRAIVSGPIGKALAASLPGRRP